MDEQTIDLKVLLKVLTEHLIPIIISTIVAGIIGFFLAFCIIPKEYTAEALMYVENSAGKTDESAININDINAAQKLVNTCQILFTSEYILGELSDSIDNAYSAKELSEMITIQSVNSTEVLSISVVSKSANNSKIIADKLVSLSEKEFMRVIKTGSIEVVSAASLPKSHTFPSVPMFTAVALLIGLAGSYFVFLIMEILDIRVKDDDDLAQIYGIPVFAEIVDFMSVDKSGYKYSKYGKYGKYSHYAAETSAEQELSVEDDDDGDDNDMGFDD